MNRKIFSACFSLIGLLSLLVGCTSPATTTTFVEPAIPANYTTYVDERGLFSISYPDYWEVITSQLLDAKAASDAAVKSNNNGFPIEVVTATFGAGLSDGYSYSEPLVYVGVEPLPLSVRSQDQLIQAVLRGTEMIIPDYHEISRTKTIVDGREATIIEWEGTFPQYQKSRYFQMYLLAGGSAWGVECIPPVGESDYWRNDFNSIFRSLRIYDTEFLD
jgi:hypothetical protein